MDSALILTANWMKSSWLENDGYGHFEIHTLPVEAQLAPVFGIQTIDLDLDGLLDVVLVGNDFGMEVQQGRADAFNGLVMRNTGTGLHALRLDQSGFFVRGDAKCLVKLVLGNEKFLLLAGQNNAALKAFSLREEPNQDLVRVPGKAIKCLLTLVNGKSRVAEFYWGDGFQAQAGRFVVRDSTIREIKFLDDFGQEVKTVL
jgi:hypothetical protein